MTNQKETLNQTSGPTPMPQSMPATIPATSAPKESIVAKIIGGFSWWISSLTGKPQVKQTSQSVSTGMKQEDPDNPVTQDVEALKKLVGKISLNVAKTVVPKVNKTIESSSKTTSTFVQKTVDKGYVKVILKIFFAILLIITVSFIGLKFFKSAKEQKINPPNTSSSPVETSTPTPIIFIPIKPSLYVEDQVILKLEQDIDVLTREISGTNIKETQLNTPALDFNISF